MGKNYCLSCNLWVGKDFNIKWFTLLKMCVMSFLCGLQAN